MGRQKYTPSFWHHWQIVYFGLLLSSAYCGNDSKGIAVVFLSHKNADHAEEMEPEGIDKPGNDNKFNPKWNRTYLSSEL